MEHKLAKNIQLIKPSPTLAITQKAAELKRQGVDVIGLGAGEPDFDTPDFIKQAAKQALDEGFTKYTPVDGIPALKEAIQHKLKKDNKTDYDLNEIIVTVGCKQALYNFFQVLLSPEEEVLIPTPYWVSYPAMVKLAGSKSVFLNTSIEQNFKISAGQLEQYITPKTRALILNSPSNPTGVAYTAKELRAIADVLLKHPNILIASDDIYENIQWNTEPFHNILMVEPKLKERTVIFNGASKRYSMTGWRIGYAAGPESIIKAMKKLQGQSTSNPCSIAQHAAVAALIGPHDEVNKMVAAFKTRHDFVLENLNTIPGFKAIKSDGTFYMFPNVYDAMSAKGIDDDVEFANFLLQEARVAVVPGSAFGAPGYIRLSFATSQELLAKALERIKDALTK